MRIRTWIIALLLLVAGPVCAQPVTMTVAQKVELTVVAVGGSILPDLSVWSIEGDTTSHRLGTFAAVPRTGGGYKLHAAYFLPAKVGTFVIHAGVALNGTAKGATVTVVVTP